MVGNSTLIKFKKEVSDFGAEACLPANLSDKWIDYLDEELRVLGDTDSAAIENFNPLCAMAAIVTILCAKHSKGGVKIAHDKIFDNMIEYRIEIGLEIVHRRTNIQYESATLNNIFTKRTIECWKAR